MSKSDRGAEKKNEWNLVPLTPEYLDAEHGAYVRAIETALQDDRMRNVALSGNYGVGKSSILQEVARRHTGQTVELSLSTLAPMSVSPQDETVPPQATTPTNRIQQEIVKQLLYREDPTKARGSRFHRIGRFQHLHAIATSLLLGLMITIVFLLTGWSAEIKLALDPLYDLGLTVHLLVFGLSASILYLIRYLFFGKLHIKQFSAASATVTLDDKSVSYFDQYLDEIVYFFDTSGKDIVIFEDIDRFNDSHIFETLRSLNSLLNASPQIKKPVRFIYAIKDSIFDQLGLNFEGRSVDPQMLSIKDPARAETVRANRTKFFDLVIPVVPFITHQSARNLAMQTLGEIDHNVNPELLDLAMKYTPDMRLLKNVRNEFVVFRDRIFSGDGSQLDLSETELFAMMLYKSTHLTDFEAIRIGNSNLDMLYQISRNLVAESIKRIEREQRESRKQLVRNNLAENHSRKLGRRLVAHVLRTAQSAQFPALSPTYTFAGKKFDEDYLQTSDFWTAFVSAEENPSVLWRNNGGQQLVFTRDNLAHSLGDPLDFDRWNATEKKSLTTQIVEQTRNLKFLRSADIGDLMLRPEFVIEHDEVEQSLDAIARHVLSEGLAYRLVRDGYINRYFTLYTSTFHSDRVSPAATNFIIHHVERDVMDEHFLLDANDVDAVVRERGKNSLKETALYNISILNRLLEIDEEAADIMIQSLVGFGELQSKFIQSYLSGGSEQSKFIQRFTEFSTRVLIYLISDAELDDSMRLKLVDAAIANLDDETDYETDDSVSAYLENHYHEFESLKSDTLETNQVKLITNLFSESEIKVKSLKPLSSLIQESFIQHSLYEIGRENLAIAIDESESLELDLIRDSSQTVYDNVLNNLGSYMTAIEDFSPSVAESEQFLSIINEVTKRDESHIGEVIERSAASCILVDLSQVTDEAIPALARHKRFSPTFANIQYYIDTIGSLDENLAILLSSSKTISNVDVADDEVRVELALKILGARTMLPSALLRTSLAKSLELNSWISASELEVEEGEFFPLLIENEIIADDESAYQRLSGANWATKEKFISTSANFKEYVMPDHVQGDLAAILRSDQIDNSIKSEIAERADDFTENSDSDDLTVLAQYANKQSHSLPENVIQNMATGGVSANLIVPLLEPHLADIGRQELRSILSSLEGDYSKLTSVGKTQSKIPNSPAHVALLERLKTEGIVSKFDFEGSLIRVYRRHK